LKREIERTQPRDDDQFSVAEHRFSPHERAAADVSDGLSAAPRSIWERDGGVCQYADRVGRLVKCCDAGPMEARVDVEVQPRFAK